MTRLVDGEGGEVASKQRRGGRRVASKDGWKKGEGDRLKRDRDRERKRGGWL